MRAVEKVLTYITYQNRLLVFRHVDFPDAGIQVPGGSIHKGEHPRDAALREAREESGLSGFHSTVFLGTADFDLRASGKDEIHHRYFFHLEYDQPVEECWRHAEIYASDGTPGPIWFEFYWTQLPDGVPDLTGEQGALLPVLIQRFPKSG